MTARASDLERENAELRDRLDAATAELRDTRQRFGLISQAVAEGIYDWDIAQNRLWVSPRLIELFGWEGADSETGERPSQDWNARVHPDDFQRYRTALRGALKRETPRLFCEYRIRLSGGDYRWVEDHAVAVVDENGRAVRLAGAVCRKEAEQAGRVVGGPQRGHRNGRLRALPMAPDLRGGSSTALSRCGAFLTPLSPPGRPWPI